MKVAVIQLAFCLLFCLSTVQSTSNSFLNKYSEINYDRDQLHQSQQRVKRALENHVKLSFNSHGREFILKLKPSNTNHFKTETIEVHYPGGKHDLKTPELVIYEGHLIDEPETSFVSGTIINGLFVGKIESKDHGVYFVEPAQRYNATSKADSVIYHEDDVNDNEKIKEAKKHVKNMFKNSGEGGVGCGAHSKDVREQLKIEQNKVKREFQNTQKPIEDSAFKYSKEANNNDKPNKNRQKRATRVEFPQGKSVCSLYLKVDPFYYNQIFNSEGNKDASTTMNYIMAYMASYVSSLNSVFQPIQFFRGSSQYYSGVTFKIYRIKVYTDELCTGSTLNANEKKICESYLDAVTYLNYASLDDYSNYCLSYIFTARDFSDGTLGLAWVASNTGSVGGFCEKQASVKGVLKSLNNGMVTILNYNSRVPELVTQITVAHEVGHSFGSEHDPEGSCSPGGSSGNYLMYSRAVSGNKQNNLLFSSCSVDQMGTIFQFVVENKFCFESPSDAVCGNGIVETGEQCDCGYPDQCTDTCCDSSTCQRTAGAVCSPSEGVCCENDCGFSLASKVCAVASDCTIDTTCTGSSSTCPASSNQFKADLTTCNSDTQVCKGGECTGSICERFGLTQCFLIGNLSDPSINKRTLCNLACTGASTSNICTDSFKISAITDVYNTGIVLKPGSICSGTDGYCDSFSNCRTANAQSSLSRLAQTLLSPTLLEDLKAWAEKYWWAILIFVIIFLVIFNLVIYGLSKCLPSSNPNKAVKKNRTYPKNSIRRNESDTGSTVELTSRRRDRGPVFTTNISDNIDEDELYERNRQKHKSRKNRILE